MIRKFECLDCHHRFDADDREDVVCPNCSSDNVRYAKKNIAGIIYKTIAFIICCVVSFWGVSFMKKQVATENQDNSLVQISTDVSSSNSSVSMQETLVEEAESNPNPQPEEDKKFNEQVQEMKSVPEPVALVVRNIKPDEEGNYSLSVSATHLPDGVSVTKYNILSVSTNEVVMSSTSGSFKKVPASKEGGVYNINAELSNGEIASRDGVTGFDIVEIVDNRMSKEELQDLINKCDKELAKGNISKIQRRVKIQIENPRDDNDKMVKIMDDVISNVEFGVWSKVEVTSIGYDGRGIINEVTLRIIYSEE